MEYKRIMFFQAHPDDEMGAGGTMLKFKSLGVELMFVLVIDPGEVRKDRTAEEDRRVRLQELESVAREFSAQYVFLNLSQYPELTRETILPLVKVIRDFKPDIAMMLSEHDYHTEHGQVARLVKRSLWHARRDAFLMCGESHTTQEVWEAEGDRPMHQPNYIEDISDFMEEKLRIFSIYESQLKNKDLHDAVRGLNRYRGVMYKKGRYAEAFYRTNLIYG